MDVQDEYSGLHPDFAPSLRQLQAILQDRYGLDTGIGEGYRSPERQNTLYAQGRTAPGPIVTGARGGQSYHNYGAAVDLKPLNMDEDTAGRLVGQAIKENPDLGLTWGGTFSKLYDPLHVQHGAPLSQLRNSGALSFGSPPAAMTDAFTHLGRRPMPTPYDPTNPPPALSAPAVTGGQGSLYESLMSGQMPSPEVTGNALRTAAAYAMALDTKGASLNSLPGTKRGYQLVNGHDGSIYRLAPDGSVTPVAGPQPMPMKGGTDIFGREKDYIRMGRDVYTIPDFLKKFGATPGAPATPGTSTSNNADIEALGEKMETAKANGATTEDLLGMMPPLLREYFQARGEGRVSPTGGRTALPKNIVDTFTTMLYPDFDEGKIKNKNEVLASLNTLKGANSYGLQRAGVNTMYSQLARLAQAYDDLGETSGNVPWINAIVNKVGSAFGGRSDYTTLENIRSEMAPEAAKVARGNTTAEADIKRNIENLPLNGSPKQFYKAALEFANTVADRSGESQSNINEALKNFPKDLNQPHTQMIQPLGQAGLAHFQQRYNRALFGSTGPIERYVRPGMPDTHAATPGTIRKYNPETGKIE